MFLQLTGVFGDPEVGFDERPVLINVNRIESISEKDPADRWMSARTRTVIYLADRYQQVLENYEDIAQRLGRNMLFVAEPEQVPNAAPEHRAAVDAQRALGDLVAFANEINAPEQHIAVPTRIN